MPMREYTCAPQRRSRRAYLYVLGCVLLATVLWTVPATADIPYRLVWHFFAMSALTAALLITTRYLLLRYVYCFVGTDDGGFDFVVYEISGKRRLCVCRVSTDSFRALVREEKGNRKQKRPRYDWGAELSEPGYLLTLVDAEEITIRFSPDRDMAAMIEYSLQPRW